MDWNRKLIEAVKYRDVRAAEVALDNGADIHFDADFALRNSVFFGDCDMAEMLLKRGANVHIWDDFPLRRAAEFGYFAMSKLLLDYKADIHACDDEALRHAAEGGCFDSVQLYVKRGANIHARDDEALYLAAANGYFEISKFLADNGADVNAFDKRAIYVAKQHNNLAIAKYLEKVAANANAVPNNSKKPVSSKEEKAYQQFKLKWMLDHDWTLEDLISELSEQMRDSSGEESLEEIFKMWEEDAGFGGSIWPCFDEYIECVEEEIRSAHNEIVINKVKEALEQYGSDVVDVVWNENTGYIDIMQCHGSWSDVIFADVVPSDNIDKASLEMELNALGVGYVF